MKRRLEQDELAEDLCIHCEYTDFGNVQVNTGPHNLCEGSGCAKAYQNYLENSNEEIDDDEEEL